MSERKVDGPSEADMEAAWQAYRSALASTRAGVVDSQSISHIATAIRHAREQTAREIAAWLRNNADDQEDNAMAIESRWGGK